MPIGSSAPGIAADEDIYKTALGIVSWNVNPYVVTSAAAALTSGRIDCVAVPYRAGQRVTRVGWNISVAAAGAAPTGMFVGVCSATTMLMDSANLAANAAWTNTGLRTLPLSSVLTIPADGVYYHMILQNGAFGTTQPTFERAALWASQIDGAGATFYATAGNGQTALPAVNAAVVLTVPAGVYWSTVST